MLSQAWEPFTVFCEGLCDETVNALVLRTKEVAQNQSTIQLLSTDYMYALL